MPFNRFPEADAVLGPEMRSTGEVMGIDLTTGLAFMKSQIAAGGPLPEKGTVFLSLADRDKALGCEAGELFHQLGFSLVATTGTAAALRAAGIPVAKLVAKLDEEGEDGVDLINRGEIHLVVNSPRGRGPRADGAHIRAAAQRNNVPLLTTAQPRWPRRWACSIGRVTGWRCARCRSITAVSGEPSNSAGRPDAANAHDNVAEVTDLTTRVGSITLPNPIMSASGTAGHGAELARYFDLSSLGAVVVKSLSPLPWAGNPPPRVHETAAGMINSVGLQGPGIQAWLEHELPALERANARVVASIWGRTVSEFERAAELLADAPASVIAVEVNVSCPNLEDRSKMFAHSTSATFDVLAATAGCRRPRWAKVEPQYLRVGRHRGSGSRGRRRGRHARQHGARHGDRHRRTASAAGGRAWRIVRSRHASRSRCARFSTAVRPIGICRLSESAV